jgi:hypothetical protein
MATSLSVVTVPNVIGMSRGEAEQVLTAVVRSSRAGEFLAGHRSLGAGIPANRLGHRGPVWSEFFRVVACARPCHGQ